MVTSTRGLSPLVFLQLTKIDNDISTREQQVNITNTIAKKCIDDGLLIVATGNHVNAHLHKIPPPSLRIVIMAKQSKADMDHAIIVLRNAVRYVLK